MSAPDYAQYKLEDFSCAHGGVHRCENAESLSFLASYNEPAVADSLKVTFGPSIDGVWKSRHLAVTWPALPRGWACGRQDAGGLSGCLGLICEREGLS